MKNKKSSFFKKLLIYCAVWLVLILAASAVMWSIMLQYEAAQPQKAIEELLVQDRQQLFTTALESSFGDVKNEYEPHSEVAKMLAEKYSGELSYSRYVHEYTHDAPAYIIKDGDKGLFKIKLKVGEKTGFFGLYGFTCDSIELLSDVVQNSTYSVIYPKDAVVTVNGKELSGESQSYLDAYSFGHDDFSIATLENFFIKPTLNVTLDKKELSEKDNGSLIVFDYPDERIQTLTVSVPSSAAVTVNERPLEHSFLTETKITEADALGKTEELSIYSFPTAGEIKIDAIYGGKRIALENDGGVFSLAPQTYNASIALPQGAILYANGIAVDEKHKVSDSIMYTDDFEGLKNHPKACSYTLENLYTLPAFTATLDGEELASINGNNGIVFVKQPSKKLNDTHSSAVIAFMKTYLKYMTSGARNTRENLDLLKTYTVAGSKIYRSLEDSYIGITYVSFQSMKIEYLTADNFTELDKNTFLCEVSYKINLKNFVGNATEESRFRIAFMRTENGIRAVNMTSLKHEIEK